jgi:hypothetical protein
LPIELLNGLKKEKGKNSKRYGIPVRKGMVHEQYIFCILLACELDKSKTLG